MARISQAEGRSLLLWTLLRAAIPDSEEKAANELVQFLGQDDAQIVLAATYIRGHRMTIADYLAQLKAAPVRSSMLMGTADAGLEAWRQVKAAVKTNPELLPDSIKGGIPANG